jgi:putative transport protein
MCMTSTVTHTLRQFLHDTPALSLFLTVLLGTLLGRIHIRAIGFGAVVGTLIAGMLVGIFATPELPDLMRWAFLYLFLFSIGYSVGPQLFSHSLRDVLPQFALAAVVAVTGVGAVATVSLVLGFDEGLAVGVFSGGLTHSAALGTGISAIAELPIPAESRRLLIDSAPLGDAITYGFGDLGLILYVTWLGPWLMGSDLKREADAWEQTLTGPTGQDDVVGGPPYQYRTYRVERDSAVGATVRDLEQQFASARVSVQRVQRGSRLVHVTPLSVLERGDLVAVAARRGIALDGGTGIGPEVDVTAGLVVSMVTSEVVVTRATVVGTRLQELASRSAWRGVYLETIRRGAELLPRAPAVRVERGDLLRVVGTRTDIERAAADIGYIDRDPTKTDLTFLTGGICCGLVLALARLPIAGVSIGLGAAGSILAVGVLGGWLRSKYPVFGAVPDAAQQLLMDIGLMVFVALVGLKAGPHAVEAYQANGGVFFAKIFGAGVIVTVVPLTVASLMGRYVLNIAPLKLLSSLAGAQTCPPALAALREITDSDVPVLAYALPYAIGSMLLTIGSPVVVAIVRAFRAWCAM